MLNMLFSLTALGENIVSGLTGAFGKFWYLFLINAIGAVAIILKICETQNKNRKNAGATAPACGLYLNKVEY